MEQDMEQDVELEQSELEPNPVPMDEWTDLVTDLAIVFHRRGYLQGVRLG